MDGLSYWTQIPAEVMDDRELCSGAKFLYATIVRLDRDQGGGNYYAYPTNQWLSDTFRVGERSISRWIKQLEQKGYIRTEMVPTPKGAERRIYAGVFVGGVDKNVYTGVDKTGEGGVDKTGDTPNNNVDYNNMTNPPKPPKGAVRGEPRKETKFLPDRFERFWQAYPAERRREKQSAMDEWDRLHPDDALADQIARGFALLTRSDDWKRGVGIPYPGRFLKRRLWDDLPDEIAAQAPDGELHTEEADGWD